MRTFISILFIICLFSINLSAQIDYSGIPSNSSYYKPLAKTKNTWQISPSTIVNSFPAPMSYIADIAFDGQHILAEGYNEYLIYKIDPVTGNVVGSVPTDIKRPYGLAFNGTNILILDNLNKVVKEIDADDGTIYNVYPVNFLQQSYPTGLAWTGNDFWFNDAIGPSATTAGDKTLNFDSSGMLINQYDATGDYPSGMAYDGNYIWTVDNVNLLIHQIDPVNYNVIKTVEAPGGIFPNGLAWDGQYLWVANNDADSIYQLDVGTTTEMMDIAETNKQNQIYPNPAKDRINIKTDPDQDITAIIIYSANGQIIQELPSETKYWNCTEHSGIFFIHIVSKSAVHKEKIIVI